MNVGSKFILCFSDQTVQTLVFSVLDYVALLEILKLAVSGCCLLRASPIRGT